MGLVQSAVVSEPEPAEPPPVHDSSRSSSSSSSSSSSPASMESLIAEAAAFGEEASEDSLDAKAKKALECPCIAALRSGPCGGQFSDAFLCFLKSTEEEKNCIKAYPDAFSKDVLEDDEAEKEELLTQDYKIYPPNFAKASPSPKPKL